MLALEAVTDLFTQRVDDLVDDSVVDEVAVLAASDDAGMEEHAKVLGDVLLAGAGGRDEFLNAGLASHQLLE